MRPLAGLLLAIAVALGACGSDDEGTALATPDAAVAAWVDAVNDRDWAAACAVSVVAADGGCEALLRDALGERAEEVRLAGSYRDEADATETFAVENADGLSALSAEPSPDGYRVHFEVRRIR